MPKTKISTPYPSLEAVARELGVAKSRITKIVDMVRKVQKNEAARAVPAVRTAKKRKK